jgi:putative DNA primase/helicase
VGGVVTPLELFRACLAERGCNPGGGDRFQARCPAHDDRVASLSVGLGEDGRILVHCHAGCTAEEILTTLGLAWADLYPDGSVANGHRPEVVSTYPYVDEQGAL